MTDIDPSGVSVLRVTEAALAMVLEARASEAREESLALWVEINGSLGGAYTYDMYFQAAAPRPDRDARPVPAARDRLRRALLGQAFAVLAARGDTSAVGEADEHERRVGLPADRARRPEVRRQRGADQAAASLTDGRAPSVLPLVEVLFQRVERAVPVARQGGQELLRHLHRRGAHPVADPAPLTRFGRHQAGLGQQHQVLGDRLPGDRQPDGQVRGRRPPPEASAARMARRLGSARAVKTRSAIASASGGVEVAGQLVKLFAPALRVAVVRGAVGVLGQLGETGLDHGQPGARATRGLRVNST